MKFKADHMKDQLEQSCVALQKIATYTDELCQAHFGKECLVTRVWDRVAKESGVHPAKRAVDFRVEIRDAKGSTWYLTRQQAQFLVDAINKRFPRKDKFQTAMLHEVPGSSLHIHVQIPIEWLRKGVE